MPTATFPLGPLQTNSYIFHNNKTAIAIDVGGEPTPMLEYLKKHNLNLAAILITHRHFDHIYGVSALSKETKAKVSPGQIDLIKITGDSFMLSNKLHVRSFVEYFDSLDIPYAIIWGNHDQQGRYNPTWLSNQFRNAKNAIYIEPDHDDLYGRSNFVINLNSGNETKWQLTNLDSGASYSELVTDFDRGYDYLRDDQTDWWLKQHERVGDTVPNITYYHISQQQNPDPYRRGRRG